jgi:hypothetical protein
MPDPLVLPIAAYAPDLPDYPAAGSANVRNVYPRTPQSYGAVPQPAAQYNALNARCQGAAAFRDKTGQVYLFAGDVNDLYSLTAGASGWSNASKAAGAYSIGSDLQWQFVYFNGDVIATDYTDPVQFFTPGVSSTFTDLPGGAPKGKYIAVVKNAFVVLGNTFDPGNGALPQRLWWCDAGNAKSWSTPGTTQAAQNQAGAVDLLGGAGQVQGFASDLINADAVVFQEYAVRRMMYVGPPDIFSLLPVENAKGTPAPYSIVVNGGIAYYWGQDGIYAFDGGASLPIGANRVDKTVYADLDQSSFTRVIGASDPVNRLIWWAYPGFGNVNGNPNRLLAYNWLLDRFTICDITCETLAQTLSVGYTLDQLYTILGYSLDTLPAPLDSTVWMGGRPQLVLFDTSHKLNFLTGTPLAATVETQEIQPTPGRRTLIRNARPLIDGATPSVAIGYRDRQQDTVSYSAAAALNRLGTCPGRVSGRYIRAKLTIPATTGWTNISGVELDIANQGRR